MNYNLKPLDPIQRAKDVIEIAKYCATRGRQELLTGKYLPATISSTLPNTTTDCISYQMLLQLRDVLGYLPSTVGGDKDLISKLRSTRKSIDNLVLDMQLDWDKRKFAA